MNILSNDEMKSAQKKLQEVYQHSDLKLKVNMEELIEASESRRDLYFFKKPESQVRAWIKKVVPLSKKLQSISLQEEESALFKVITYIFLLIIYKNKDGQNQYLKDQIKCSLYSEDVDLLEIKNHSFNKKMYSDRIKAVIAHTFKEIEYLSATSLLQQRNVKAEDIVLYLLSKNDIVSEGFHLFYRVILAKLEVENAQNCIEDVNPEEAISNLVEYFDIDCRVVNQIYLFNDDGVFIAEFADELLLFGKYYQNQMDFGQTSNDETEEAHAATIEQLKPSSSKNNLGFGAAKALLKQEEIDQQDVRNFNFLLDTDRGAEDDSDYSSRPSVEVGEKGHEGETPSFTSNEDLKFGKKKDSNSDNERKELEGTFNKIKDRIHNERINEIESEEEDNAVPEHFSIDSPDLNPQNAVGPLQFQQSVAPQNKFLNFADHSEDGSCFGEDTDNEAPTPMLGGGDQFHFGQKLPTHREDLQQIEAVLEDSMTDHKESVRGLSRDVSQEFMQKHRADLQKQQIRQSAIRRQTLQEGSSKSKSSSTKKLEMKTSKNQIEVIDQTASRTSLYHDGALSQLGKFVSGKKIKTEEQQEEERKNFDAFSSLSSCTCHAIKQKRIKLQSQIIEVVYEVPKEEQQAECSTKKKDSNALFEEKALSKTTETSPTFKKYDFKTDIGARNAYKVNTVHQAKQAPPPQNQKQKDKRAEFLNFLKKDKKELIKKLSDKRNSKANATIVNAANSKAIVHNNDQNNKKTIKQSMFVGVSPTNQASNPETRLFSNEDNRIKNKTMSPSNSVTKMDSRKQSGSKLNADQSSPKNVKISYGLPPSSPYQQARSPVGKNLSQFSSNGLIPQQNSFSMLGGGSQARTLYSSNDNLGGRSKAMSSLINSLPPNPTMKSHYSYQQQPVSVNYYRNNNR